MEARKEGRKSIREGWNNDAAVAATAAAVAHPAPHCTQTNNPHNNNTCAVTHPHSTLIMIHTKPQARLATLAQEPLLNTYAESKCIAETLLPVA